MNVLTELDFEILQAFNNLKREGTPCPNYTLVLKQMESNFGLSDLKIGGQWRLSTIERAIRQLAYDCIYLQPASTKGYFYLTERAEKLLNKT